MSLFLSFCFSFTLALLIKRIHEILHSVILFEDQFFMFLYRFFNHRQSFVFMTVFNEMFAKIFEKQNLTFQFFISLGLWKNFIETFQK